jgi:hypothetical protein
VAYRVYVLAVQRTWAHTAKWHTTTKIFFLSQDAKALPFQKHLSPSAIPRHPIGFVFVAAEVIPCLVGQNPLRLLQQSVQRRWLCWIRKHMTVIEAGEQDTLIVEPALLTVRA